MIAALAALLGAVLTALSCYCTGTIFTRRLKLTAWESVPLSFTAGAACLHLAVFLVLALHIAWWPVLVAMLLVPIVLRWRAAPPRVPQIKWPAARYLAPAALFLPFFVLYFFHAWAPEESPDGSSYHLGLVARYLRAHGFERITTNMYAALSEGVEMLYVPAFAIGRHSAAALVHFAFTLALAAAIYAYGRRIGKPWAGAAAALLTFASPVVGIDGTTAYIDVALAAVVFSTFYFLEIWDDTRANAALAAAGLLAGYAFASKYTAFVMAPYALGYIAWRSRKLRPVIIAAACAALMAVPWLLKNWIFLHNPVAPFANQIFRTPYFHIFSMNQYAAYFRRYDLPDLRKLPFELAVGGATSGVLGATFLAAPIALVALRHRAGRRLLLAGAVVASTFFLNIGTRFLIPALPFLSLAMMLALPDSRALLVLVMMFHAVASWPDTLQHYPGKFLWRLDRILYKEALRIVPQDRFLRETDYSYGQARMIEAAVPKGERILALNGTAEAYTTREMLVGYESAFAETLNDAISAGFVAGYQPRVLQTFHFPEKTLSGLRVVQTATATPLEQWSIHELRFFDRGQELPRAPEWRLKAWPNPWEVQLAFDNSPATRWRTWETAGPGMYLEASFGRAQAVDEVRIETSYDYKSIQVEVQSLDQVQVATQPEVSSIEPPPNIRRAATYELKARGVRYLFVQDADFASNDIRADPEGWGLVQIAEGYGSRVYRVAP